MSQYRIDGTMTNEQPSICQHGQPARSCESCMLTACEAEIDRLAAENAQLRLLLRRCGPLLPTGGGPSCPCAPCSLYREIDAVMERCEVGVTGHLALSIASFEQRVSILLADEQRKISPDNALIGVLCDAIRLAREYVEYWNSGSQPRSFNGKETR